MTSPVPFLSCVLATLIAMSMMGPARAEDPHFEALRGLEESEQHRQLSLMLLVSAGVDGELIVALEPLADVGDADQPFQPDDYTTPLARIVDQASLLAGAYRLFRFTSVHGDAVRERLDVLERDAVAKGQGMTPGLSADTILVRQAIADAMATELRDETAAEAARRYRQHTVVLRNALEFADFQAELDALTERAIASVGGKLDAYQRMFDDETSTGTFDRRIRSAELIYLPEGQFDPEAGRLTEDMLDNMVLMESEPHR